ncbi:hypothetical protein D3C76_1542130 [compost metagenome]
MLRAGFVVLAHLLHQVGGSRLIGLSGLIQTLLVEVRHQLAGTEAVLLFAPAQTTVRGTQDDAAVTDCPASRSAGKGHRRQVDTDRYLGLVPGATLIFGVNNMPSPPHRHETIACLGHADQLRLGHQA